MDDLKPSRIIVDFRFGERNDVREFIVPGHYEVEEIYRQFESLPLEERLTALWRWVVEKIDYPLTRRGELTDLHTISAFEIDNYPIVGPIWRVRRSQKEYFQTVGETIAWRVGDCEDSSFLLASLLRHKNLFTSNQVFVCCGFIGNLGHCWCEVDGRYLETTLDYLPPNPPIMYSGYAVQAKFNDVSCYGDLVLPERDALPLVKRMWGLPTKLRRDSCRCIV